MTALSNGVDISPKYIGNPRVIGIAVAALAGHRPCAAFVRVPRTAKSLVAAHLAAAISGDSLLVVQHRRHRRGSGPASWNYA